MTKEIETVAFLVRHFSKHGTAVFLSQNDHLSREYEADPAAYQMTPLCRRDEAMERIKELEAENAELRVSLRKGSV